MRQSMFSRAALAGTCLVVMLVTWLRPGRRPGTGNVALSPEPAGGGPPPAAGGASSADVSIPLRTLVDLGGRVIAPSTFLVALSFYFGWVRTHATYAYFGIDADQLELGTTDYLLRSPGTLFPLIVALLLAALLATLVYRGCRRLVAGSARRATVLRRGLRLAGIIALLAGVGLALGVAGAPAEVPPGLLVVSFAVLLLARTLGRGRTGRGDAVVWLLAALLGAAVFWGSARLADGIGQGRAQQLEAAEFASSPDVIVYSSHRVAIDAKDVQETDLGSTFDTYRYRYAGYKLLARGGNGRLLLIPYSWSTGNPYTVVVSESDGVHIVFAPVFQP